MGLDGVRAASEIKQHAQRSSDTKTSAPTSIDVRRFPHPSTLLLGDHLFNIGYVSVCRLPLHEGILMWCEMSDNPIDLTPHYRTRSPTRALVLSRMPCPPLTPGPSLLDSGGRALQRLTSYAVSESERVSLIETVFSNRRGPMGLVPLRERRSNPRRRDG